MTVYLETYCSPTHALMATVAVSYGPSLDRCHVTMSWTVITVIGSVAVTGKVSRWADEEDGRQEWKDRTH